MEAGVGGGGRKPATSSKSGKSTQLSSGLIRLALICVRVRARIWKGLRLCGRKMLYPRCKSQVPAVCSWPRAVWLREDQRPVGHCGRWHSPKVCNLLRAEHPWAWTNWWLPPAPHRGQYWLPPPNATSATATCPPTNKSGSPFPRTDRNCHFLSG